MAIKLSRKVALGIKTETAQGVAVSPSTATDYILVQDVNFKVGKETLERDYKRSNLDTLASVTGKRWAEVTFTTELKNSGAASLYTPFDTALKSCGLTGSWVSSTASYAPISDAPTGMLSPAYAATIVYHRDGLKHQIAGALGSFKLNLENGKFGTVEFTMKGSYSAVSDDTQPSPTLNTTVPPIVQSALWAVSGSYVTGSTKIEVDSGNDIQPIDDVNSVNAIHGFMLTGRKPVGSMDVNAESVATFDSFGKMIGNTEFTSSFHLGSAVGQHVVVQMNQTQFTDVTEADTNGIFKFQTPLRFNGSGNDWISIKMY